MTFTGKQLRSTLAADGTLTVELADHTWPAPSGGQVLVRLEAAPINPSDLGLLFASADTENAIYEPGRVIARMPDAAVRAMSARIGKSLPVGNEGSGTVVAAGEDAEAQALLGRRVACLPGGAAFGQYGLADARLCVPIPDHVGTDQAASAYVNPLTALGFTETMRMDGFTGLVHTAAASNLGQMLLRICQEDSIPLVNVVRRPEQVALLRDLGATHVVDQSQPGFMADLIAAIADTGAMLGFDAVGGGKLASQILSAMEAAAGGGAMDTRYGSNAAKKLYIYGALDLSPTLLTRNFGFAWDVSGWLLTPWLTKAGPEVAARMRTRVMDTITTTFASRYKARVSLAGMLTRAAVTDYNARHTGEKYLVLPQD